MGPWLQYCGSRASGNCDKYVPVYRSGRDGERAAVARHMVAMRNPVTAALLGVSLGSTSFLISRISLR